MYGAMSIAIRLKDMTAIAIMLAVLFMILFFHIFPQEIIMNEGSDD